MNKISKYNDFLLEKEFNSIVSDFFRIVEDVKGVWTSPTTIEWDYTKKEEEEPEQENDRDELTDLIIGFGEKALNKLREFLKKLPKEKIKEYYIKLINKFKSLPTTLRRKLVAGVTAVFLTFVSLSYLISPSDAHLMKSGFFTKDQTEEIISVTKSEDKVEKHASFEEAQKLVKTAEAGYSDDKGDVGNWIDVPSGGRRFIGTNHGISAPILAKYFKEKGITRLLSKNDMIKLSYKTALKIFKNNYWDQQELSTLKDQDVANIIYDGCVNQGVDGMRSVLRDALEENGIEISDSDIIFSKEILSKANEVDQEKLFDSIKKFREERYRDSKTFNRHGEGWLNRLDAISYKGDIPEQDRV